MIHERFRVYFGNIKYTTCCGYYSYDSSANRMVKKVNECAQNENDGPITVIYHNEDI
jgi:hypothetical protein